MHGEHVAGVDAQVLALHAIETVDEETGAEQEDDGERRLHAEQDRLRARADAWRRGTCPRVGPGRRRIPSRAGVRGQPAMETASRLTTIAASVAVIDVPPGTPRPCAAAEGAAPPPAPRAAAGTPRPRRGASGSAPSSEELRGKAPSRHAERDPDGDLPPAAHRPQQQEADDVGGAMSRRRTPMPESQRETRASGISAPSWPVAPVTPCTRILALAGYSRWKDDLVEVGPEGPIEHRQLGAAAEGEGPGASRPTKLQEVARDHRVPGRLRPRRHRAYAKNGSQTSVDASSIPRNPRGATPMMR